MSTTFHVAAGVAILATVKALTQLNAVRALLYLIVSLLATAVVFYVLGAPFAAALEAITYAGAIMVLFVFVAMMLNLGPGTIHQERAWLRPRAWLGPSLLATVLLAELLRALFLTRLPPLQTAVIGPEQVGAALFGPYAIGVELASLLLLSGLVGAYHLGYRALALYEPGQKAGEVRPPVELLSRRRPEPPQEQEAS